MAASNILSIGSATTCSCEPERHVPVTTHYTGALQALLTTLLEQWRGEGRHMAVVFVFMDIGETV